MSFESALAQKMTAWEMIFAKYFMSDLCEVLVLLLLSQYTIFA
jgi:hypothetical protein